MYSLLIRNVTAVDPAEDGTHVLPGHDIAIADNRIAAIQPTGEIHPQEASEMIDGTGMAALPGLINTHAHTAMVVFRGTAEDVLIEEWFNDYIWSMETNLTPDDVAWGVRLGIAEMIASGVTTVADHYFEMHLIAEAIETSGLRAHLAPTMFGADPRAELVAAADFAERWHGAANGRIQAWLGPHAPYTCPPEFLRMVAHEAQVLGLGCHIHVSETAAQMEASIAAHGVTPVGFLQQIGFTEGRLLCAHAAHATPDDIAILATSGAGVAHCPKTFLKLASSIAPVTAMQAAGVPVGLGSDGAASNNTLDIMEQMRLAAMLQKHERQDARVLPLHTALAMATSAGARALGQEHELGRLLPNYLADVILVRLNETHIQPVHDICAALVYAARASDIDTTIVDGRVLMRNRALLTLDKDTIMREVAGRAGRLGQRGHGRTLQTYQA